MFLSKPITELQALITTCSKLLQRCCVIWHRINLLHPQDKGKSMVERAEPCTLRIGLYLGV